MASTRERNGRYIGLFRDAQGKRKSAGTYATEKEALKAAGHAEALANPPETVEAHSTTVRGRVTVAGYAPGWLSSQMLEETSRESYGNAVKRIVRHLGISTTNRYVHVMPGDDDPCLAVLGEAA